MPEFNPHSPDQVDYKEEMEVYGNGRLIKARFPDDPHPNVNWFWIPLGNCNACIHYKRLMVGRKPECDDKKISLDDFRYKYITQCDCPQFEAGIEKKVVDDSEGVRQRLDAMKAVGIVPGKPSQRVEVIVNAPWSIGLSQRAHREAGIFRDMAQYADYLLTHPGANDPSRGEYVDLSDDLEPKTVAPITP